MVGRGDVAVNPLQTETFFLFFLLGVSGVAA